MFFHKGSIMLMLSAVLGSRLVSAADSGGADRNSLTSTRAVIGDRLADAVSPPAVEHDFAFGPGREQPTQQAQRAPISRHNRGASITSAVTGPAVRQNVKNYLIRPRKTPWGNYKGHALSEPVDNLSSLISTFGNECFGSALVGTFTLAIATWANMNLPVDNISRVLTISLTFMVAIMVSIATDSKMALNPAASLTAMLLGKISVLRFLVSAAATHTGWITGAGLAKAVMGELRAEIGLGAGVTISQAFAGEIIAMIANLATIFTTELEKGLHRPLAPLYIGGSFFLSHLMLIDVSGCSVNPARALAPSIVNGHFPAHFWISQVPAYLASIIATGVLVSKKYILETEARNKRLIDPDLVDSHAPTGPEVLLTAQDIDGNIENDARALYSHTRSHA
jgi:glycerol uptake facilitator-like aquaporin